jgi:hypothetical protein
MRTLPKNIHCAARMVATLWPLQLSLQATSMGVGARIRKLGTIGPRCQRRKPITGPVHSKALVLAAVPLCGSSVKQLWQGAGWNILCPPTILAWDWSAIRLTLPVEADSS